MIIKRNFSPLKVWQYTRSPMQFVILWSVVVWLVFQITGFKGMALQFTPVGVLGSALAIFVAFRNNSAYARWWEARTIWGGIVNNSRIFCRQILAGAENSLAAGKVSAEDVLAFRQDLTYRQIAFAHALRLQLRQQDHLGELEPLLPAQEFAMLLKTHNKPNLLLLTQGLKVREAIRKEWLGAFDNISLEPTLAAFSNFQGSCERIKNTPLPRQYDFFTRVFVLVFATFLPFGLLSFFNTAATESHAWLVVPLSIVVSGIFIIMERTGAANEDPFENRVTDVPLTAICNTIERDLKEMLGEPIPEKMTPQQGYLM